MLVDFAQVVLASRNFTRLLLLTGRSPHNETRLKVRARIREHTGIA